MCVSTNYCVLHFLPRAISLAECDLDLPPPAHRPWDPNHLPALQTSTRNSSMPFPIDLLPMLSAARSHITLPLAHWLRLVMWTFFRRPARRTRDSAYRRVPCWKSARSALTPCQHTAQPLDYPGWLSERIDFCPGRLNAVPCPSCPPTRAGTMSTIAHT